VIWYAFYNLQPGNGVGPILTATVPTQGQSLRTKSKTNNITAA